MPLTQSQIDFEELIRLDNAKRVCIYLGHDVQEDMRKTAKEKNYSLSGYIRKLHESSKDIIKPKSK